MTQNDSFICWKEDLSARWKKEIGDACLEIVIGIAFLVLNCF